MSGEAPALFERRHCISPVPTDFRGRVFVQPIGDLSDPATCIASDGREMPLTELNLAPDGFRFRADGMFRGGEGIRIVLGNGCYFSGEIVRTSGSSYEGRYTGFTPLQS